MSQTTSSAEQYTARVRSNRTVLMVLVTGVMLAMGAAWGLYWLSALRGFESTDNSSVQEPVVQITPQAAGTVIAVLADDTDLVKSGQPLVRLDLSLIHI